MRRCLIVLTVSCLGLAPCLLWAQDGATPSPKREQIWKLFTGADEQIKAGNYQEAEKLLLQAKDLDPNYDWTYENLGCLYDTWHQALAQTATSEQLTSLRTRALEAYGQLVTLRPDHPKGRAQVKRLFYDGEFPRVIRAPYLAYSGVGFTSDEVRAAGVTRRIAYTNSLLFHEDMKRGPGPAPPVQIPVPVTGEKRSWPVNRSCYGYTMGPDTDRFALGFVLSWPSETLSAGTNYSPLGTRLMHLLLRYNWYARLYLNLPHDPGLVNAYLCPEGPVGAETFQNSVYFYDIKTPRSGIEWAREAAHEYGHLVLPEIGSFTAPERFASGQLGERLFIQYLAQEAGEVAGDSWPSEAARQAVGALWPGEDFAVADYIDKTCRGSLDYWLTAGPDAILADPKGADGMQYTVGFLLWVQAAYGPEMLRGVLQGATAPEGGEPGVRPGDYLISFRNLIARQAQQGPITVDAGSLNLKTSKLAKPPLEGALGRRQVTLAPGDQVSFHVYLPAAAWSIAPQPAQAELTVTMDGKGPLPLDANGALPLGRLPADAWHTLTFQLSDRGQPMTLERIVLRLEKET